MTIEERIERAQKNAETSAWVAQEANDEAMGAEAIGLKDKAETCRDRERRHTERAAVWSAAARSLREREQAIQRRYAPAVSLAAADGTPYAEDQAHALDAERCEALGLAS